MPHEFLSDDWMEAVKAIRPPGRTAPLMWAMAAAVSAKNIIPKRETTASWGPRRSSVCASPTTSSTGAVPFADWASRARARSIIGAEMSIPTTRPLGPTAWATTAVVAPKPQPTSSTRSPGCGARAPTTAAPKGSSIRSWSASLATQRGPPSSPQ